MTDPETPAGAVEALAAALSKATWDTIEAVTQRDGTVATIAEATMAHLPRFGWQLTRSVDVERWQRIETAARTYREWFDSTRFFDGTGEGAMLMSALRDALGEG